MPKALRPFYRTSHQNKSPENKRASLPTLRLQNLFQLRGILMEMTNEQLKAENEFLRKRIKEIDLIFGKNLLAMQAACIEAEHGEGDKAAMQWIFNTLFGPGEFAPDEEKDAQAYFNREATIINKELDEVYDWFHELRKREQAEVK